MSALRLRAAAGDEAAGLKKVLKKRGTSPLS